MTEFNKETVKDEYQSYSVKKALLLADLEHIILNSNTPLEGNSFYYHN